MFTYRADGTYKMRWIRKHHISHIVPFDDVDIKRSGIFMRIFWSISIKLSRFKLSSPSWKISKIPEFNLSIPLTKISNFLGLTHLFPQFNRWLVSDLLINYPGFWPEIIPVLAFVEEIKIIIRLVDYLWIFYSEYSWINTFWGWVNLYRVFSIK